MTDGIPANLRAGTGAATTDGVPINLREHQRVLR